jgi:hypothetical protein
MDSPADRERRVSRPNRPVGVRAGKPKIGATRPLTVAAKVGKPPEATVSSPQFYEFMTYRAD